MKRIIFTTTTFLVAAAIGALELPNGMDATVISTKETDGRIVEARLADSVTLETKYGDFATKPNSEVCFYESGKLKSFHITDNVEVTMSCGTFTITSTEESGGSRQNRPIVLDEEGNIISAYIPETRHIRGAPPKNVASTKVGSVVLRQKTSVTFFPDGSLESGFVSSGTQISFTGEQISLAANTRIAFYDDGSLKEYSPANPTVCYGINARAREPLTLYRSGKIESFVPTRGETFKMGDLAFLFKSGETVDVYENAQIRKAVLDCAGKDFNAGGYNFLCKTEKELLQGETSNVAATYKPIALEFYENGGLKSAESADGFTIAIGGNFIGARRFEVRQDGVPSKIQLSPMLQLNTDEPNRWFNFSKWYFNGAGETAAFLGWEFTKSPKGRFYDRSSAVICIMDGNEIMDKIYDEKLTGDSEVVLDESGVPVAYTAHKDVGGNTVLGDELIEYPIKK